MLKYTLAWLYIHRILQQQLIFCSQHLEQLLDAFLRKNPNNLF